MKGTIVNFRLSRHVQKCNHMIITVDDITSREKATELVGKDVEWKSPAGKVIKGSVASAHGNKGNVRVIFEKGMPGQALTTKVEIKN
jgi:large subunit ribosomal protein L35Ae